MSPYPNPKTPRTLLEVATGHPELEVRYRLNASRALIESDDRKHARRYNATIHVMWMALLAAFALTAMCCTPRHTENVRDVAAEHGAAVSIVGSCAELPENVNLGSGVIVSPRSVLTASHVVHPTKKITNAEGEVIIEIPLTCHFYVEMGDGTPYPITVSKDWTDHDIARLTAIVDLPYAPVALASVPPAGEDACIVARRPWRTRRCGEIQYFSESHGFRSLTGVIIQLGNSGSGVYDRRGRLIGIAVALFTCANGQWCEGAFSPLETVEGGVL